MTVELDHFFILTEAGAPAAEQLIAAGLVESTPNTHPGQGTANRRFFFANAMLEPLCVHIPFVKPRETKNDSGPFTRVDRSF